MNWSTCRCSAQNLEDECHQFEAGFSLHEGSRLSPGVYFLRISGEGEQMTKKVVIAE
ncbi:MAG: T9SS type A sorting domain-containing protein [Haliscomenobacter sp.]|nr:T9SS type A sorting domain-containing protein [Haliscomenobacter sp.]MBK9491928.1 T9SS type A sorting domain-containing protein [Haliscomenobacter sp.]